MLSYVQQGKKEFTTVSNLRFINRINFMLSWVEPEKMYNLEARSYKNASFIKKKSEKSF